MFFVNVLRSRKTGRLYAGAMSDLQERLAQHNSDQSTSTKNRGPWDLAHHEEFATLAEAVRRERSLQSGQGREELKRILTEGQRPRHSGG